MLSKKHKGIIAIVIAGLLLIIGGISYAYFTSAISGQETYSTMIVTGGVMQIHYDNLSNNITIENIYPRENAWVTKNFTVTGTNTTGTSQSDSLEMNYKIGINVLSSNFPEGTLTYSLENTRVDSGTAVEDIDNAALPLSGTEWFGTGSFVRGNNQVHAYTLTIYYPDLGANQNDGQEKRMTAQVIIEEDGYDLHLINHI